VQNVAEKLQRNAIKQAEAHSDDTHIYFTGEHIVNSARVRL